MDFRDFLPPLTGRDAFALGGFLLALASMSCAVDVTDAGRSDNPGAVSEWQVGPARSLSTFVKTSRRIDVPCAERFALYAEPGGRSVAFIPATWTDPGKTGNVVGQMSSNDEPPVRIQIVVPAGLAPDVVKAIFDVIRATGAKATVSLAAQEGNAEDGPDGCPKKEWKRLPGEEKIVTVKKAETSEQPIEFCEASDGKVYSNMDILEIAGWSRTSSLYDLIDVSVVNRGLVSVLLTYFSWQIRDNTKSFLFSNQSAVFPFQIKTNEDFNLFAISAKGAQERKSVRIRLKK